MARKYVVLIDVIKIPTVHRKMCRAGRRIHLTALPSEATHQPGCNFEDKVLVVLSSWCFEVLWKEGEKQCKRGTLLIKREKTGRIAQGEYVTSPY